MAKTRFPAGRVLVAATLALVAPLAASAQEAPSAGEFTDWSVFNPAEPRQCFIVSPPVKTRAERGGSAATVRRGDIRLFVTVQPGATTQEVSFTSGYPFREGSAVDVKVASEAFRMAVGSGDDIEWAWALNAEEDAKLIAAMRKGAEAEVSGTSARGTVTFDTFSLKGFSAALDKAIELCGQPAG
jgi:invasion protein IalB